LRIPEEAQPEADIDSVAAAAAAAAASCKMGAWHGQGVYALVVAGSCRGKTRGSRYWLSSSSSSKLQGGCLAWTGGVRLGGCGFLHS
jgi:hypothetical protein